jgi:dipeptidyl aminopeptidase/acylaminoacyl peptidase
VNPAAIAFDPATGQAGAVTLLQHRTGILVPSDVSPDGKWLALVNVPDRQQDLFIMRPDGSALTRLTDDEARDWFPRFTPDGSALTFISNPRDRYEGWSLRIDGSGRTRITDLPGDVTMALFAPDGKRLLAVRGISGGVVGEPPWPMSATSAHALQGLAVEGDSMTPSYWSRDGRWLSGFIVTGSGELSGHGVFDLAAGRARRLNADSRSYELAWLPGYRRVLYFTNRGALVMQDIVSLQRREVTRALPYPPDELGSILASPDGRTLYYGALQEEANIWVVKRSPRGTPTP